MRRLFSLLVMIGAVLFISDGTGAQNSAGSGRTDITWYTNIPASDADSLSRAFMAQYPALLVRSVGAHPVDLVNRLKLEALGGKKLADAVFLPSFTVPALKESGLLEKYQSSQARFYAAAHKDPAGFWTYAGSSYLILAYNTKLVSPKDVPQSWTDLLDPRWEGKISIEITDYPMYEGLILKWGKKKAREYLNALAKNKIIWELRRQKIIQMIVAGEVPLGVVGINLVTQYKKENAPVDWLPFVQPLFAQTSFAALARNGPNPGGGKLFVDFLLSARGQEIMQSQMRISHRRGMPCPLEVDCRELDVAIVGPQKSSAEFKKIQDEFREITSR